MMKPAALHLALKPLCHSVLFLPFKVTVTYEGSEARYKFLQLCYNTAVEASFFRGHCALRETFEIAKTDN